MAWRPRTSGTQLSHLLVNFGEHHAWVKGLAVIEYDSSDLLALGLVKGFDQMLNSG